MKKVFMQLYQSGDSILNKVIMTKFYKVMWENIVNFNQ